MNFETENTRRVVWSRCDSALICAAIITQCKIFVGLAQRLDRTRNSRLWATKHKPCRSSDFTTQGSFSRTNYSSRHWGIEMVSALRALQYYERPKPSDDMLVFTGDEVAGTLEHTLTGHQGAVASVVFSPAALRK
jgi:hypothetical protein